MSSSKRKLIGEKPGTDDKSKPSVFDRLGPGISSRTSDLEVTHSAVFYYSDKRYSYSQYSDIFCYCKH